VIRTNDPMGQGFVRICGGSFYATATLVDVG
jgi:hypothetical protein